MVDEMYLQKGTQLEMMKMKTCIIVLMIAGLKKSIPYVIKACPEISICGDWLADEIAQCISTLCNNGFIVRAVVTDNHSAVSAFNMLRRKYENDSCRLFIKHPENNNKTYLFYDNIHLIKNIRNDLFNAKKFVFPEISFNLGDEVVSSPAGFISWKDLHGIYDVDSKLPANLRKAHKLN